MTKEELYKLTAKFLNETLSAEEKERLEQWYCQGTEEEITIDFTESSHKNETALRDNLLQRVRASLDEQEAYMAPVHRVHFLKTSWFRSAAAVIVIAGGVAVWWEISRSSNLSSQGISVASAKDIQPGTNRAILTVGNQTIDLATNKTGITVNNTIAYTDGEKIMNDGSSSVVPGGNPVQLSTPKGGQYQAVLPDGSRVWLNAASSIRFPSKFTGANREVEISGEAYLEIAKNSKQPFRVKANGTEIQVLGTSFNINAYTDEGSVRTTLVEGGVKVVNRNSEAVLKPGQQAIVADKSNLVKVNENADIGDALAWKKGLFSFNNADIKTIMRQLSRWYDVEVVYEGEISKKELVGNVSRNINASEVLKMLEYAGIHFKIDGKKIIVTP